jgi:hypothetical protein
MNREEKREDVMYMVSGGGHGEGSSGNGDKTSKHGPLARTDLCLGFPGAAKVQRCFLAPSQWIHVRIAGGRRPHSSPPFQVKSTTHDDGRQYNTTHDATHSVVAPHHRVRMGDLDQKWGAGGRASGVVGGRGGAD